MNILKQQSEISFKGYAAYKYVLMPINYMGLVSNETVQKAGAKRTRKSDKHYKHLQI